MTVNPPVGTPTSNSSTSAAAFTIALPAGAQSYLAEVWGSTSTPTAPSGWTLVGQGSGSGKVWLYTADASSSPGTSWAVAGAGAFVRTVVITGFTSSMEPVLPADIAFASGATSPSITTTSASTIVRIVSDGHDANTDVTYPTSATLARGQKRTWVAADSYSQTVATAASQQSSAGATGTAVWTVPSAWEPQSATVAIRAGAAIPAPGSVSAAGVPLGVSVTAGAVSGADSYVVGWRRTDLTPPSATVQAASGWALDRLDDSPGNGNYSYTYNGAGVRVYVLDSGVRYTHTDFTGRTAPGYNVPLTGSYDVDSEPHGTAVASCAVGTVHGVAKGATLVSVRVCVGPEPSASDYDWPGIAAAFDWIIADAAGRPAVAVYAQLGPEGSGAPYYAQATAAFQKLIDAGISVVSAMGNSGAVFTHVPTSMPDVVSVGGTTSTDTMWSGSSYGADMDILAPGQSIPTAIGDGTDSSVATQSGTSFASPIVAGVIARILQGNPRLSPARVREVLYSQARHVITGVPSGQTGLVYGNANTDAWSNHPVSGTTATIDGLDSQAAYEVRVAAVVGGVQGPWSTTASATTRAGEPPVRLGTRKVVTRRIGTQKVARMYLGATRIM